MSYSERLPVWVLKRTGETGYGQTDGYVIVAATEQAARDMAAAATLKLSDEPPAVWTDRKRSTCRVVADGRPRIVMRDFHAG